MASLLACNTALTAALMARPPTLGVPPALLPLVHPPNQKMYSTPQKKKKSRHQRANTKKALESDGGSRLERNRTPAAKNTGPNTRTCLRDAVTVLLPDEEKERANLAITSQMPEEGDTLVSTVNAALGNWKLTPVSREYIKQGGPAFHLLQERSCRLVVKIVMTNPKGKTIDHFVAWDGKVIHNRPFVCRVNKTYDRNNPIKSKLAFRRLFPDSAFTSLHITTIYKLEQSDDNCVCRF
jgi:hypothetical protein